MPVLFAEDLKSIKAAIDYFNKLPDVDKISIVADLNPRTFKLKRHFRPLLLLFSRVQQALSSHDGITIGNRLLELGLEETYARLIVSNMKKHAPTLEYTASQLNVMDERAFQHLEKIINALWVDREDKKSVMDTYRITADQLDAITGVATKVLMSLLRGTTNEKRVLQDLEKNGLSRGRAESLLRAVCAHKESWYSTYTFRHLQDLRTKVDILERQNRQIMRDLKAVLDIVRRP